MKNEKLSRELGNIDDELLEKVWEIDDAQKLKAYSAKSKNKSYHTRTFAIAACATALILIMSIAGNLQLSDLEPNPSAPDIRIDGDENSGNNLKPPASGKVSNLQISSIDMLNYYAALCVLTDKPVPVNQKRSLSDYDIVSLDRGYGQDSTRNPDMPPTTPPKESKKDIYYYEVDPNVVFKITKVIFFQIELTDENGFLASNIGTGIVDVVITENSLDNMITFKNGNRFFTCLENSWSQTDREFSTHKFIDGFRIIKNFEQENYAFYIYNDGNGQVTKFDCRSAQNGGERPDENVKVISTTVISDEGGQFTIADLENYFNNADNIL